MYERNVKTEKQSELWEGVISLLINNNYNSANQREQSRWQNNLNDQISNTVDILLLKSLQIKVNAFFDKKNKMTKCIA